MALTGWAALGADAVAGDVAGLCANEEVAIKVAKRIVINDMNIFMGGILPATSDEWQVRNKRANIRMTQFAARGSEHETRKSDN